MGASWWGKFARFDRKIRARDNRQLFEDNEPGQRGVEQCLCAGVWPFWHSFARVALVDTPALAKRMPGLCCSWRGPNSN